MIIPDGSSWNPLTMSQMVNICKHDSLPCLWTGIFEWICHPKFITILVAATTPTAPLHRRIWRPYAPNFPPPAGKFTLKNERTGAFIPSQKWCHWKSSWNRTINERMQQTPIKQADLEITSRENMGELWNHKTKCWRSKWQKQIPKPLGPTDLC